MAETYSPEELRLLEINQRAYNSLPRSAKFDHKFGNFVNIAIHNLLIMTNKGLTVLPIKQLLKSYNEIEYINCSMNKLRTLPNLPPNLEDLNCSYNILHSLPDLPQSLTELNCSFNLLTSLPELPQSLKYIECGYNKLNSLPDLPQSLTTLRCLYNNIEGELRLSNANKLTIINVDNNQLTSLNNFPQQLQELYCNNNNLVHLDAFPQSLKKIGCNNNQLTQLPELPISLEELYCVNNQLTQLPELPINLETLICAGNLLTSLPTLPHSLIFLVCEDNPHLESLPRLPPNLEELYCDPELLLTIEEFPPPLANINGQKAHILIESIKREQANRQRDATVVLPSMPLQINENEIIEDPIAWEEMSIKDYLGEQNPDKILFVWTVNNKNYYAPASRAYLPALLRENSGTIAQCMDNDEPTALYIRLNRLGMKTGGYISTSIIRKMPQDKNIYFLNYVGQSRHCEGPVYSLSVVEPTFFSGPSEGATNMEGGSRRQRRKQYRSKTRNKGGRRHQHKKRRQTRRRYRQRI